MTRLQYLGITSGVTGGPRSIISLGSWMAPILGWYMLSLFNLEVMTLRLNYTVTV